MRDVTATYRDGRDAHLSNIYIRIDFNVISCWTIFQTSESHI